MIDLKNLDHHSAQELSKSLASSLGGRDRPGHREVAELAEEQELREKISQNIVKAFLHHSSKTD